MITDIAGLILAIALLLAVGGGLYIVYNPPKGLKKFKLKDFEGEFSRRSNRLRNRNQLRLRHSVPPKPRPRHRLLRRSNQSNLIRPTYQGSSTSSRPLRNTNTPKG